ncbi:helix-turn-helix domain-containing protein [Saccharococcus thermophilus]|uniref:Putative transcriptional regulator n=1 Tax=Saccharococcus thermophilus TaxID=29396 RepID=A0A846MLZ9_9BACL|nr:helix-turn-helix transcriptional regulator [Saccharococcus thermophilus]NIK16657.1 putative transcriptional regulator [Saccharococcus thermophilus]
MIRIKLAELLGKHKMRVTDLAEEIEVHKNTLYRLYNESSTRVDLEVLEKICDYFKIELSELMEYDPQYIRPSAERKKTSSS